VPAPGLVEFDPAELGRAALDTAATCLAAAGPVLGVGLTCQRASTVAWDARTGNPVGPGLGWQDLRTAGTCLELQSEGLRFSPSESGPKMAWLLDTLAGPRPEHIRVGTVDSWLAWCLSGGSLHVTDPSNAAVTGLLTDDGTGWDAPLLERFSIPRAALPAIVDSSGAIGALTELPGAPLLCGILGDQQASLAGQGCFADGAAKATFGTGAMLDVCLTERPGFAVRGEHGCFPIIAWRRQGRTTWGAEAIALSAGSAVDWLVEDLEVLRDPAESAEVAARCSDTGGVVAVPAFLGLGTPLWDFGARAVIAGLTRGTGRPELVRAVLEGVAHTGADLLDAAEADTGARVERLRVDGGMSANDVFVQALADACSRPVELSRELEATTLGAGYLAGLAAGMWADEDDVAALWKPRAVVEPKGPANRDRWHDALERARRWYPELSAIQF
jgi:glycerol kinase